eukprot:gene15540-17125_t
MAQSLQIQPMPEFCPDTDIGASLASRWKTWLAEFEMFLTASGGKSSKIKKRALRDPKYDLAAMLLDGRRDEINKYQSKDIETQESLHAEANKITKTRETSVPATQTRRKSSCWNCGRNFPHRGPYPAKGKTCNTCGQENHFSKVCKGKHTKPLIHTAQPNWRKGKKAVHPLNLTERSASNSSDSDGYLYAMRPKSKSKTPKAFITVHGHKFEITTRKEKVKRNKDPFEYV